MANGNPRPRTTNERIAVVESQMFEMRSDLDDMRNSLSDIRDKYGERPNWIVVFALTSLASMVVGLAVAFATTGGG